MIKVYPDHVHHWTAADDAFLRGEGRHMSISELAAMYGISYSAVRNRRYILRCTNTANYWTPAQIDGLRALYDVPADRPVHLKEYAASIGKNKTNVCRKARELGLERNRNRAQVEVKKPVNKHATLEEARLSATKLWKEHLRVHGHPRGMAGKKHTPETRLVLSARSKATWARFKAEGTGCMSQEHRQKQSDAMSLQQATNPKLRQGFSRCASGRRADLGDQFFRSMWEANIARYLNWLKERGEIFSWEYEARTFWFEAIKRGVRSYKPDFEIRDTDGGTPYYWEVKGWDYARGITARKRMAKYYPQVKLVLIDAPAYKAIAKYKALFPEWETKRKTPEITP